MHYVYYRIWWGGQWAFFHIKPQDAWLWLGTDLTSSPSDCTWIVPGTYED